MSIISKKLRDSAGAESGVSVRAGCCMKPRCHNRPAYAPGRWHATGRKVQNGTREHPGAPVVWGPVKPVLRFYPRWFEDQCATWIGVGIGRPTEKYPNGVPYPMAHGYDCRGCRWLPDANKEDV